MVVKSEMLELTGRDFEFGLEGGRFGLEIQMWVRH